MSATTLKTAKKAIGWLPTHALYCLGHWTSLLMNAGDGWFEWLFPAYRWLMLKSCQINDWAGLSVWRDAS